MPKLSRRRAHSLKALSQRYSKHGIIEQQRSGDHSVTDMDDWGEVGFIDDENTNINIKMQLSDIGDLFEICKTECSSRNLHRSTKN